MRLVTHNLLRCNVRGVSRGYPLRIEAERTEVIESAFDADVVRAMMLKMDLSALHSAASDLGMTELVEGLPASTEDSVSATSATIQSWDEAMLRRIHRLLFEVALVEGSLVCPETGRKFPVRDGIPNMLLHEDEV